MAVPNPRRNRLAARLRALREAAVPSGAEMARRTDWVQPKVSRLETGAQLPSEDDLRVWTEQTGAHDELDGLIDMLAAARVEYTPTAELVSRGALPIRQAQIGAMEAAATRIGEYQPSLVPGLLQTPAYARALLDLPGSARSKGATRTEVNAIVAGRLERQNILREPDRRLQFVLGEAALLSAPAGVDVQVEQLDYLAEVSALLTVDLGVVPLRRPMVVMPLSGFRLLDEEFAFVESLAGEQRLDDPREVRVYVEAFDELRRAALTGAAVVELVESIAAGLR